MDGRDYGAGECALRQGHSSGVISHGLPLDMTLQAQGSQCPIKLSMSAPLLTFAFLYMGLNPLIEGFGLSEAYSFPSCLTIPACGSSGGQEAREAWGHHGELESSRFADSSRT